MYRTKKQFSQSRENKIISLSEKDNKQVLLLQCVNLQLIHRATQSITHEDAIPGRVSRRRFQKHSRNCVVQCWNTELGDVTTALVWSVMCASREGKTKCPCAAWVKSTSCSLQSAFSLMANTSLALRPSWHNQEAAINHGCPRLRQCSVGQNCLPVWDSTPYSIVMCPCFFLHLRRCEKYWPWAYMYPNIGGVKF